MFVYVGVSFSFRMHKEKVKPDEVRHFVSGFLKVMLMFGVLSKSVRIRYSIYEVYGCGANFAG